MFGCSAGHTYGICGRGTLRDRIPRRPTGCLRDVRAIREVLSRYSACLISQEELGSYRRAATKRKGRTRKQIRSKRT